MNWFMRWLLKPWLAKIDAQVGVIVRQSFDLAKHRHDARVMKAALLKIWLGEECRTFRECRKEAEMALSRLADD